MSIKLSSNTRIPNFTSSLDQPCLSDRLPEIKPSHFQSQHYLPSISLTSLEKASNRSNRKANTLGGLINHKGPLIKPDGHKSPRKNTLPALSSLGSLIPLPPIIPTSTKQAKTWDNAISDRHDKASHSYHMYMPGFVLTQEQYKEESDARTAEIQGLLQELCAMEIIDHRNKYSYEKEYIIRDTEKACRLAESVLSVLGVQVRSFVGSACDSGMMINPITDKVRLANFYKIFVPEMCKFSFTFLSKLRLNTISVCESLKLTSKDYIPILNQKLHNGLFVLEKMEEKKGIQHHWFKIILHHFFKVAPDFFSEWQKLVIRDHDKQDKQEKQAGKIRPIEELLITFSYMVGVDRETYGKIEGIRMREMFLREAFAEFDLLTEIDSYIKHRDE